MSDEPFDVFVRRVCPDYADTIVAALRAAETRADEAEALFVRSRDEYRGQGAEVAELREALKAAFDDYLALARGGRNLTSEKKLKN